MSGDGVRERMAMKYESCVLTVEIIQCFAREYAHFAADFLWQDMIILECSWSIELLETVQTSCP